LDFTQWKVSNSPELAHYWVQGTVISCVIMGLGMVYIVIEVHFIPSKRAGYSCPALWGKECANNEL
jgi:hypothetical protein